jgi:hypothetical protein
MRNGSLLSLLPSFFYSSSLVEAGAVRLMEAAVHSCLGSYSGRSWAAEEEEEAMTMAAVVVDSADSAVAILAVVVPVAAGDEIDKRH